MRTIRFHLLSMEEAEEVVAEIWSCVERYDLPSPSMTFDFHASGRVSIGVSMTEPAAQFMLMLGISSWSILRAAEMRPAGSKASRGFDVSAAVVSFASPFWQP